MVQIGFKSVKSQLLCFWCVKGVLINKQVLPKKMNKDKRKPAQTILKYPDFKRGHLSRLISVPQVNLQLSSNYLQFKDTNTTRWVKDVPQHYRRVFTILKY